MVCHFIAAQTVSGFVRENATGEPLGYSNVFVQGTSIGAASDMEGYFVITNVPTGEQKIAVSVIGYEMAVKTINITENENLRLDFRLERTVVEGQAVDVFGEAEKMRQLVEPSRITLDLRTLETMPAFIEPDLFRTVQMLPGVQTLNDYSSALYVRGSTPDQNLIMLDGITIYNPYHLGGIFSTFNTDAIKEADFHAGGFPARYGGRMGAILNVINREGNTERIQGNANISLISSKGLLEGPLPKILGIKGSWMVAGRRTYFDQLINPLLKNTNDGTDEEGLGDKGSGSNVSREGDDPQFPYYFYDYQIKVIMDLNQDHRFTYSRFYGDDVLDFSFTESIETYDIIEDYSENYESTFAINWPWGNHTNSLTWRWLFSPKLIFRTFVANSRYRFDFDMTVSEEGTWRQGSETGNYKSEFSFDFFDIIDDRTIETEVSWHGIPNHQLMAGVQVKQVDYDLGMKFAFTDLDTTFSVSPLQMKDRTVENSIFFQDKWDISPKLVLQLGGRTTKYSLHDTVYLDPRFGLKYLLRQDLSLKLSLGRYHQFLTIANAEDESWRLVDFWLGLPADRPATFADHAIVGIEYLAPESWILRAETYYKHFENLITLKQGELFTEGGNEGQVQFTPFNEFYETRAYAYGLEFLIKKTAGRLRGWIGYTFAEVKKYIDKHGWYHPMYDRTHTLNIVGDLAILENLHFSSALQASSGQPHTPALGRYQQWNAQHDAYEPSWYFNSGFLVGDKNSERLPSYFRMDVGLKENKSFFGFPYERYVQLVNVTNHINALTYQYRNRTNRLTGETMGVQRAAVPMFPFFLTFGIRVEI